MANTLQELCKKIRIHCCHCWVPAHVDAEVPDILTNRLAEYHQANPEEIYPENGNAELEMEDLEAI